MVKTVSNVHAQGENSINVKISFKVGGVKELIVR